jgi:predicted permease
MAGAALRPLMGMAIAWVAARLLGLDGQHSAMLFLFGALPPAVLNYVFAERYRQEPEKVASIVMIGNFAALLFISAALAMVL